MVCTQPPCAWCHHLSYPCPACGAHSQPPPCSAAPSPAWWSRYQAGPACTGTRPVPALAAAPHARRWCCRCATPCSRAHSVDRAEVTGLADGGVALVDATPAQRTGGEVAAVPARAAVQVVDHDEPSFLVLGRLRAATRAAVALASSRAWMALYQGVPTSPNALIHSFKSVSMASVNRGPRPGPTS